MTLDASGNLAVGTTTPQITGAGRGNITLNGSSSAIINLSVGDVNKAQFYHGGTDMFIGNQANGYLMFQTNATERARIDSSGNLLVGTTTGGHKFMVSQDHVSNNTANLRCTNAAFAGDMVVIGIDRNTTNNSSYPINYYNYGATAYRFRVADSGNVTNTNNSYGAISDVKLKENIVDASPKLADLMQVKVRQYNFKNDQTHKQIGVIAQELETVFPTMVDESPDRDVEGNDLGTTTKQVKYSVFVPMLIKAMQEQQAIIETMRTEIDALKAKVGA
jgi:hypothetical protein